MPCWRPICCGGRERRGKWLRTPLQPHGNDRWTASFTPPSPGRYEYAIEAWTDVFATWRRDILAKRQAGLDVSLETLEGWQILEDLKPRNAADARLIRDLCRECRRERARPVAAGRGCGRCRHRPADRPHPQRHHAAGRRPAARPRRRLVRDGAAQPGQRSGPPRHLRGLHRAPARDRSARIRCGLSHPHPSDRPHQPQGPQQCRHRQAGRSRQLLRHRLGGGRPRRHPSGARHARRFPPLRRRLRRPRDGGGARFRGAVLARPSVDRGASRMVQAPARRLDPIRGKSAQEVPGHRQPGFLRRRRRGAVAGAARRGAVLGRAGGAHLPGRQSPHQAVSVLGVADPRGAGAASGRDLPGRGLHPPEGHEGARQARLHPVLHLFHLAHRQERAAGLSERAHRLPGAGIFPPQLLRQHARHPADPAAERRALDVQGARRARRHARPAITASTTASSSSSTSRCRARRNI